jgi:nitrite reductase (NADH) small subunit
MEHRVGTVRELQSAGCRVIDVDGQPVSVISTGDGFFAVHDRCPHMGASMSQGTLGGTFVAAAPHEYVFGNDEGVIRCPWHGWEFDLESGRSLLEPDRVGLKTYEVTVVDGDVVLHT